MFQGGSIRRILVLNLPSPPYWNVTRDWAGGFGTGNHCPRRSEYGHTGKPSLHPFLPFVAGLLHKAGYEFSVLDCQALRLSSTQVLKFVAKLNPDIILSVIGLPSMKKDLELLDKIKKEMENTILTCAGTTCRVLQNDVLNVSKVDILLRDFFPYVSAFIPLVEALKKQQDLNAVPGLSFRSKRNIVHTQNIQRSHFSNFDPHYESCIEPDRYRSFGISDSEEMPYIPIVDSIGCPYTCIYCPYPIGFGNELIRRDPEKVADEIENLHYSFGIKGFLFRDQSFPMDAKHAIRLCEEIVARKLDIKWACEARVNDVSREILRTMKKAGCIRIHFGVETGDPQLIKIGKPGVHLEATRKAFKLSKEIGIFTLAHVIIGLPGENHRTLERTYNFILDLDPNEVSWNILTPYPGTRMFEIASKNSWIVTRDWSKYTSHNAVMNTENLDAHELEKELESLARRFFRHKLARLVSESIEDRNRLRLLIPMLKSVIKNYVKRFIS